MVSVSFCPSFLLKGFHRVFHILPAAPVDSAKAVGQSDVRVGLAQKLALIGSECELHFLSDVEVVRQCASQGTLCRDQD